MLVCVLPHACMHVRTIARVCVGGVYVYVCILAFFFLDGPELNLPLAPLALPSMLSGYLESGRKERGSERERASMSLTVFLCP